jgi:gluconolactonase
MFFRNLSIVLLLTITSCKNMPTSQLYIASDFTADSSFTGGAEGPAVDAAGNLYAVNFAKEGTIGIVTPLGEGRIFKELPNGSVGNGIRFNSKGDMLIADYTNHNILRISMQGANELSVYAHEATMNQPNDIAIDSKDRVYASDPNWKNGTGQIWRIDTDGKVILLEDSMGTTNGIEVSADEKKLYVNESVQRNVWAYDLSENGDISNKRLLINFPDFGMDGMRCDKAGNLYITRHGKGVIAKVSPDGKLLMEIPLKGKLASNIAFGGVDGKTAYITLQDRGNVEKFLVDTPGREWKMK